MLKLSYDQLPYHLKQCVSYCSLFPNNYQFYGEELVCIWISQGFVYHSHSSKKMEEIGQDYLADLVNSGFFRQVKSEKSVQDGEACYVMCDLMHDLDRMVSKTDCATIDGPSSDEMMPTIRHLAIITGSVYHEDLYGNKLRNEYFGKKLLNIVTSVKKLRSMFLIGQYDSCFSNPSKIYSKKQIIYVCCNFLRHILTLIPSCVIQ